MTIRDDLARVLAEWWVGSNDAEGWVVEMFLEAADVILASDLIKQIRAEALRDAADAYKSGQLTGIFMGRDDYPREWLRDRADKIERGEA